MIWYEVIEDMGDGSTVVRRFKTEAEASLYVEKNQDWCYDGYSEVDTESPYFWDTVE